MLSYARLRCASNCEHVRQSRLEYELMLCCFLIVMLQSASSVCWHMYTFTALLVG